MFGTLINSGVGGRSVGRRKSAARTNCRAPDGGWRHDKTRGVPPPQIWRHELVMCHLATVVVACEPATANASDHAILTKMTDLRGTPKPEHQDAISKWKLVQMGRERAIFFSGPSSESALLGLVQFPFAIESRGTPETAGINPIDSRTVTVDR